MTAQLDRANAEAFDCSFIEGSKDDAPPGLEHATGSTSLRSGSGRSPPNASRPSERNAASSPIRKPQKPDRSPVGHTDFARPASGVVRFARDSLLEEDGFEPSVPRERER